MTSEQRRAEAALVLAGLEPAGHHNPRCLPPACVPNGLVGSWARTQAAALDDAGLLCALHEDKS